MGERAPSDPTVSRQTTALAVRRELLRKAPVAGNSPRGSPSETDLRAGLAGRHMKVSTLLLPTSDRDRFKRPIYHEARADVGTVEGDGVSLAEGRLPYRGGAPSAGETIQVLAMLSAPREVSPQ